MTTTDTPRPPQTIADVIARTKTSQHSREWFAKDTLSWWCTRVGYSVYPGPHHTFFVTSERIPGRLGRRYTVRQCDAAGEVSTYGELGEYDTRDRAHRAAASAAAVQTYCD